jgi:hypothetical protein
MRNPRVSLFVTACVVVAPAAALAADPQVDRGKYLVTITGCNDCHTPGTLLSRIATTTIVVIEFHYRSGQPSGIVGGAKRAADSW